MTDLRALATELLAALAWVNKRREIPDGLDELEERAAKALAEPEEPKLPLVAFPAQREIPTLPYSEGSGEALERYRQGHINMKKNPKIPGTYIIK